MADFVFQLAGNPYLAGSGGRGATPLLNMTAWELFELITSVYYGKQYYLLEPSGWVYSRLTHKTMSQEDALGEFLDSIEEG